MNVSCFLGGFRGPVAELCTEMLSKDPPTVLIRGFRKPNYFVFRIMRRSNNIMNMVVSELLHSLLNQSSCHFQSYLIVYLPTTHSKIRDCIIIGLENFGVVKHFISKGVQAIESYSDVSGSYPFLPEKKKKQEKVKGLKIREINVTKFSK